MTLLDLAARTSASPAFRTALESFERDGRPNERIDFNRGSPAVKVARTLTQLLVRHPDLNIEKVHVEGESGCEFFRGTLRLTTTEAEQSIRFYWDCRWKAEQVGWTDYFGFPDQIRAAQEFGHDCFRTWEPEAAPELEAIAPIPG